MTVMPLPLPPLALLTELSWLLEPVEMTPTLPGFDKVVDVEVVDVESLPCGRGAANEVADKAATDAMSAREKRMLNEEWRRRVGGGCCRSVVGVSDVQRGKRV